MVLRSYTVISIVAFTQTDTLEHYRCTVLSKIN